MMIRQILKSIGFVLFITAFMLSTVHAQFEWLAESNPCARVKAMGGAGVALENCAGLVINPGSIAYDPEGQFSFFYGNLSGAAHYGYMEYIYPFSVWGSLGGGAEIKYADESTHTQNYIAGLSLKILNGLAIGASAKAVMKTMAYDYGEDFGVDAGVHIRPYDWISLGIAGYNLKAPEIKYETSGLVENVPRNLRAGISFIQENYFTVAADLYAYDVEEKYGSMEIKKSYGIELYPDPAVAIRGGIKESNWRAGLGIISRNMNFDYAYVTLDDSSEHFFQFTAKFGVSETRKEKLLAIKEDYINRQELYVEGSRSLNNGEVAAAKQKVEEYISKYGEDEKIRSLEEDIDKWLNRMRKENLGRADKLKKEILVYYYQDKINEALVKLENLKLLAPNYEDVPYLEHLLRARVLLEKGLYSEAEQELVEALKINPDSKEVKELHKRLEEVIRLSE